MVISKFTVKKLRKSSLCKFCPLLNNSSIAGMYSTQTKAYSVLQCSPRHPLTQPQIGNAQEKAALYFNTMFDRPSQIAACFIIYFALCCFCEKALDCSQVHFPPSLGSTRERLHTLACLMNLRGAIIFCRAVGGHRIFS